MKVFGITVLIIAVLSGFDTCKPAAAEEKPVVEIGVHLPHSKGSPEMSGLAWYKDYLILLPQYPDRYDSPHDGKLFALPKTQILSYLERIKTNAASPSPPPPLEPQAIELIMDKELLKTIKGFQGFETLGFAGDKVFMTIEAEPDKMLGYLVSGSLNEGMNNQWTLTIHKKAAIIQPQASIPNAAYETLVVTRDRVIVIFEGNGANINASPLAYVYDHELEFVHAVAFPHIEYRVTDATAIDNQNRFWCFNYFWPDPKEKTVYNPADDPIAAKYGEGKTHGKSEIVERLLEFQYLDVTGSGSTSANSSQNKYPRIVLIDTPPLQLELAGSETSAARNWEGIARLENERFNGFLLITDEHPRTMLVFVASGGQGGSF